MLKAELKVPETQAKDVQIGQPASIDTHNGVINGTRDARGSRGAERHRDRGRKTHGRIAAGARPDLSVDGTINLEQLSNVLYVGRPAFGQEKSTVSMFKLDADGKGASRVQVDLGRSSVTAIEILGGLKEGDQVVLSDMSRWEKADRIRFD